MSWHFGHKACGISTFQLGTEPAPRVLEGEFLTTGQPGKSLTFLIFFFLKLLFIFWLCWVFVAACRLSLVAVCGLLIAAASLVVEHRLLGTRGLHYGSTLAQQLWLEGLVAPQHMKSYRAMDHISVPCIDRQILNHWTAREVHGHCSY